MRYSEVKDTELRIIGYHIIFELARHFIAVKTCVNRAIWPINNECTFQDKKKSNCKFSAGYRHLIYLKRNKRSYYYHTQKNK